MYAFERGATKTTGGKGWADVWKRGYFAWEYKGKRKNLRDAYAQLQQYAVALENPPLLTVCDMETFEIHTNWTNTVHEVHRIGIEDLREASYREKLKSVFSEPERLKPGQTRQALTEKAAKEFAGLALHLRARGHDPQRVAHFVNRLVFCMFADDVGLLHSQMFRRMLEQGAKRSDQFPAMASQLFAAMRSGGLVGFEEVAWFNGGLFDDHDSMPMEKAEIELVLQAARLNWAEIDPALFGTLFERGLDPDKRSQLGAHYTDHDKIMMIIKPVIVAPLTQEWEDAKRAIHSLLDKASKAKTLSVATKAVSDAKIIYMSFLERLRCFRVLDPACGSGNFLYLALLALKELEHRVNLDAEALGFERAFPAVGPEVVRGIEINPYAAELARVSVWIGEIQWMRRNGFAVPRNPVLKPLENIECRDAVLNADGTEADWPEADAIIGNPPFLGDKAMIGTLGEAYTERLRAAYAGRLPGGSDLVCYWFEKARAKVATSTAIQVGLVSTNALRRGTNRFVLDRISETGSIFAAWPDEEWTVEGAAVRVSLICFSKKDEARSRVLSGTTVSCINPDLSSLSADLSKARVLPENQGVAMQGPTKGGAFEVTGAMARAWLLAPFNPNGRSNVDVVKRWFNGSAITERWNDMWIIDFGEMTEDEASLYEAPFAHIVANVKPLRMLVARDRRRRLWWQFNETAPGVRNAISSLERFIVSPETPTHNVFAWLPRGVLPDKNLVVIARDDDTCFGILHSRFHLSWIRALGSPFGNHPTARRYNSTRVFRTFPFPVGLGPRIPAATYSAESGSVRIADAAKRLNDLREKWLNPPNLVRHEPEVVPGLPDRALPIDASAAAILKRRTLTQLYNERPTWLANAHRELDEAVAAAYGWPADLSDDQILDRLLKLNHERTVLAASGYADGVPQAALSLT